MQVTNLKNCTSLFLGNEGVMESLHLTTHVIALIGVGLKALSCLEIDLDVI